MNRPEYAAEWEALRAECSRQVLATIDRRVIDRVIADRECLKCGGDNSRSSGPYCIDCRNQRQAEMASIRSRASSAVTAAVRRGALRNLRADHIPCVECGKRATTYDHRDYSKPLEVDPVCRRCNRIRPPAPQTAAYMRANPALRLKDIPRTTEFATARTRFRLGITNVIWAQMSAEGAGQ